MGGEEENIRRKKCNFIHLVYHRDMKADSIPSGKQNSTVNVRLMKNKCKTFITMIIKQRTCVMPVY